MLCLRSPDGTEQQLVGNIVLGRGSHDCLSDPLISRQQLQLDCVCAEVVQLTNVGLNPIIVERQLVPENTRTLVEAASTSPASGNLTPNWHVTDLLEKGDSTCLQRNSRFYLASLQDSTTFTIVRHSGNADGGSSAKSLAAAVPDWQQQQQVKSSADSQSQADQVAADAALAAALAAAEEHEEQHHSQQHRGQPLNKSTAEDSDHNRPTKKPRLDDVPETAGHGQTAAAAAATAGPSSNSTTHIPAIGDGPFCLLAVRGLSSAHNAGFLGAKLRDLVVSPGSSSSSSSLNAGSSSSSSSMRVNRLTFVLASNYMIDMGWLLSACPDIIHADKVLVVHGLQGDRAAAVTAEAAAAGLSAPHFCAHAPPLPLAFGTHHSKGFILGYDDGGVRVIMHTANYIYADCNNKTQGLWYQDFPPKDESSPESSQFEDSLMDYVRCLHLPGSWLSQVTSFIKAADFSSSRVALVASVPGYHTGPLKLHAYGHMRLRALLQQQQQQQQQQKGSSSSCVMQCSSLGSLDEWLLQEFLASLTAGTTTAGGATTDAAVGTGGSSSSNAFARMVNASRAQTAAAGSSATAIKTPLYIVWPSVSEVQHSREGWSAGYSIPGPAKNVTKGFLSRYWCRFGGEPVGRQSAMPHIKSYGMFTTTTTQQAQAQQQQEQAQQGQQGQQQYEVDSPQQQQQGQRQQQPNISPELSWWLVTSHNLSKAAWGALQVCQRGQYRGQPQLMIRSYELGVLAAPQLEENYLKHRHRGYSCTAARKLPSKDDTGTQQQQQQQQDDNFKVKFYAWQAGQPQQQQQVADHTAATTINSKNKSSSSSCNSSSSTTSRIVSVPLPVPYRLPPQQYTDDDSPWCVDVQFSGLDGFGYACGEAPFKAYGNRQPAD